jgi:hypothetical protein
MMIELPENRAVELHDSVLAFVDKKNGQVEIGLMPAYIHSSTGEPGVDPGAGRVQNITLVVDNGIAEGQIPKMPCALSGGTVVIDEYSSANSLALPLDLSGRIELKLDVIWGGQIVIRGTRILAVLNGEPKYVEDFK